MKLFQKEITVKIYIVILSLIAAVVVSPYLYQTYIWPKPDKNVLVLKTAAIHKMLDCNNQEDFKKLFLGFYQTDVRITKALFEKFYGELTKEQAAVINKCLERLDKVNKNQSDWKLFDKGE